MTLTELISEVYTITNRPDRIAETLSAVRSATLKVHRSDYYPKDLWESGITFDTLGYLQAIEYRTLQPRWRSFKYLRKFDATAYPPPGEAGKFFELVQIETSLDDYKLNREDIVYIAGEVLQVRSSTEIQYALIGAYINPLVGVTNDLYSSWIAIDFPFAIVHLAASYVFRAIGKADEAAAQLQLYAMELEQVKLSSIQEYGY